MLGKQKNPMQTILAGTAKLSMIVRRNVFFKNLMKKNDELIRAGKTPMFVKNEDEAIKKAFQESGLEEEEFASEFKVSPERLNKILNSK